jgi:hypothetical protein
MEQWLALKKPKSENRFMPTTLLELPPKLDPPRKRWTRKDCEALSWMPDWERLELIEGELINKMGKTSRM